MRTTLRRTAGDAFKPRRDEGPRQRLVRRDSDAATIARYAGSSSGALESWAKAPDTASPWVDTSLASTAPARSRRTARRDKASAGRVRPTTSSQAPLADAVSRGMARNTTSSLAAPPINASARTISAPGTASFSVSSAAVSAGSSCWCLVVKAIRAATARTSGLRSRSA